MAAASWHQPDSIDKKSCTVGKKSNKTFEKKTINEQYLQYLQNDTEGVSIHILNDDCLRHIFLFLPIIDKVRIERVCKRWKDLSQDSWHMMKSLDLSSSTWGFSKTKIRTATLHKILLKCGKFLTQINLSDTENSLQQSTLSIVGKLCPNLTDIDVTALTISCASDISTLASNCKNITRLSLGSSTCSCDNKLKNLFKVNKNLEYLAISNNNIVGKSLPCLSAQTMHTIILHRCCQIQENHFCTALKNLKNLKCLGIDSCLFRITAPILKAIGEHCKNLNELEIKNSLSFMESAEVLHLTKLVNLKVLKFTYTYQVSDTFLINMVQQCQQLTHLDITGSDVTDVGLAAIATLPKLEKLIINNVQNITDNGLKNMYDLKELECRKCTAISDEGMSMFIRSSSYLQLLDISGCHNITNVTLDAAKDACNTRSNNLMLTMIIGGTAIFLTKKQDEEQVSSLLQIVNIDLCDDLDDYEEGATDDLTDLIDDNYEDLDEYNYEDCYDYYGYDFEDYEYEYEDNVNLSPDF